MQIGGSVAIVVLSAVVWVFLSGDLPWPVPVMVGAFALLCLLILWVSLSWLSRRVIEPVGAVGEITRRIADFDLTATPEEIGRIGGGPVTDAMDRMIRELNRLVGSIRHAASDSAALAGEISSSTEQMAAATEEVAGTTAALTRRATAQAALVRAVADDAARILAIAEGLAGGALQTVERNAALARQARGHRERLGASVRFRHLREFVTARITSSTSSSLSLADNGSEMVRVLIHVALGKSSRRYPNRCA